MRVFAIETSCDETAVALVEGEGERVRVLDSHVRSQVDLHAAYGGVVPEVAAREHVETMAALLHQTMELARGADAIAVTVGPGLAPALRVGVESAKALAFALRKPLVPVCHLEGHIYAAWLGEGELPKFPALALIVSGGHTELALMRDHGVYERLGETLDDAAGEAFDKVAKMLGLGYPGGPAVARLAEGGDPAAFAFPRALLDRPGHDFSFSGLKTSVRYLLEKEAARREDPQFLADVAASFQAAVVEVLVMKTLRTAAVVAPASIILAGGVAANTFLRDALAHACAQENIPLHVPELKFSMDNAAMMGAAGYFRARAGHVAPDIFSVAANPSLDLA